MQDFNQKDLLNLSALALFLVLLASPGSALGQEIWTEQTDVAASEIFGENQVGVPSPQADGETLPLGPVSEPPTARWPWQDNFWQDLFATGEDLLEVLPPLERHPLIGDRSGPKPETDRNL